MTLDQALTRLLRGSGLVHRIDGSGAITVRSAEGNGLGADDGAEIASGGSASSSGDDDVPEGQEGISEILVVGSRSQNVDIRRTENDPQPYVVFDKSEIEKSGATTVDDFFRKRLTMNAQQTSPSQTNPGQGAFSTNVSKIDLRGLGSTQTLILIDGRRVARLLPTQIGGFDQTDINGIPLASIERIEVLPSTAGGIYGGGATGGVINIIRKRDYDGFDLALNFDQPTSGGGETARADLVGGASLNENRTQLSFSGSVARTSLLEAGDNDLWQRAREQYFRNLPAMASLGFYPVFAGYTTNIASVGGVTLTLKGTGQSLGSSRTFVPVGFAGVDPLDPSSAGPLVANAGKFNLDLSDDYAGSRVPLLGRGLILSGNVGVRHEINSRIDLFIDASASENKARNRALGAPATIQLPVSSINNPFNQAINVAVSGAELDREQISKSRSLEVRGGLVARLGQGWSGNLEYSWSSQSLFSNATPAVLNPALTTNAYRSGQLNLIRDVNAFPLDYTGLEAPFSTKSTFKSTMQLVSARTSGPLISLPGGKINLTGLLEFRNEDAPKIREENSSSNGLVTFPRSQSVYSAYAELRVPLISERNSLTFTKSLELQGSIRHDRYSTRVAVPAFYTISPTPPPDPDFSTSHVDSTAYTVAVHWKPISDLALRASYATGFLPPAINQLASRTTPNVFFGPDPQRMNEFYSIAEFVGDGSPSLKPEYSRSASVGVVLAPSFVPRLRLSADYTKIRKRDEIARPLATIEFLETYFPDRVLRAPLAPEDQALGYTAGIITRLDTSLANVAHSSIEAWDFQGNYEIPTADGRFAPYIVATYQPHRESQATPVAPNFDTAGFLDGPLKWRVNGGINWTTGKWEMNWNFQHYSSYAFARGRSPASTPLLQAQQGAARIPGQTYHDLGVRYSFGPNSRWLGGGQIAVAILNVFNKHPPVIATGQVVGTFSPYGDPRLRRINISLRKHF